MKALKLIFINVAIFGVIQINVVNAATLSEARFTQGAVDKEHANKIGVPDAKHAITAVETDKNGIRSRKYRYVFAAQSTKPKVEPISRAGILPY